MERTFAISLTIPDNEAFTARETLRRLGLAVEDVRRADVWTFTVDDAHAAQLRAAVAAAESIFNPNKHRLEERGEDRPIPGEVWIAPRDDVPAGGAGRRIAGVSAVRRRVAWRLLDAEGRNVERAVLDRAVETFLCNPAFQKAIR